MAKSHDNKLESLARDIYLKMIGVPGFSQRTPEHVAEMAFQHAENFHNYAAKRGNKQTAGSLEE